MLPGDALEALGLDAGATAAEIKEAYRDLVKVWHPDRFGSDVRLRRKAEEKLRQINDAYRVLQSHSGPVYSSRSKAADTYQRSDRQPGRSWRRGWAASKRDVFVRAMAGFGVAVVISVVMMAFHSRPQTVVQPQVVPDVQSQEPMKSSADAAPRTEVNAMPDKSSHHRRAVAPAFQVRQLTDAEAARVQSACQHAKDQRDTAKYQDCVIAQLGSAEPDMSALSAADRSGIQAACRETKSREGVAGYNRCLARMKRLLVETSK